MNEKILEIIKRYPTDGTHNYYWVNNFDGSTEDVYYKGALILRGDHLKRTYCAGLTFEVFLKACIELNIDLGTVENVRKMKREWFVATGKRKGPVDAIVPQFANSVDLKKAKPGDFCQFWRKNGSGHSVIFLKENNGFLKYWSTQPSTNGIGERIESLNSNSRNPITEIYIAQFKTLKK